MSEPVTIYHNPRCSKSRATLALLRERGIEPRIIEYLRAPPDPRTIERLIEMLGCEPRELMRRQEDAYAEGRLGAPGLPRAALIEAMHRQPILIERPIVVANGQARIGRPPEAVLEIL